MPTSILWHILCSLAFHVPATLYIQYISLNQTNTIDEPLGFYQIQYHHNEEYHYVFIFGHFIGTANIRTQFRLLYKAGYNYASYIDTTVYIKTKEHLWLHSLTAAYEIIQKWGSIDIMLRYSNYFHDWSKNNLSLSGYTSLRIVKGLSFNLSAGVSLIHDQPGLAKEELSLEKILTRQRELETQYSYYASLGFSYTFGSIYNNVVNPRFGN